MNKKILFFSFILGFALVSSGIVSAADAHVFTVVSDARLLSIDNSGNTNATGWLAENGVQLSDTYCALTGCTYSGEIIMGDGLNITVGTGGYFVGDGRYLTNIAGANSSWTQAAADLLYAGIIWNYNQTEKTFELYNATWDNKGYVDAAIAALPLAVNHTEDTFNVYNATWDNKGYVDSQNTIYNESIAAYVNDQDGLYNDSIAAYVDDQISGVSGMDYTNVALTNVSNLFTPHQAFAGGLNSSENINLASTKLVTWDDGGSISATAGVITYKAGV